MATSTLDNGTLAITVDDTYGGAITSLINYVDPEAYDEGTEQYKEFINTLDRGREIQQSWYGVSNTPNAGSYTQNPAWTPWPWNPVQAGDSYSNLTSGPSTVVTLTNNGTEIYAKTIPRDWSLEGCDIDGYMEEWISFHAADIIKVRFKFTYEGDIATNPIRDQEFPACFFNNSAQLPLHKLVTYTGAQPWTGDSSLTAIVPDDSPLTGDWTGNSFLMTEPWAAYVFDTDITGGEQTQHSLNADTDASWGVGVYNPYLTAIENQTSNLVFYRKTGAGGCSYFAPVSKQSVAANSVQEYTFYLTFGTAKEIRTKFKAVHDSLPVLTYDRTGQTQITIYDRTGQTPITIIRAIGAQ